MLPGITPDNIGKLRPDELMTAVGLFDAQYRSEEE